MIQRLTRNSNNSRKIVSSLCYQQLRIALTENKALKARKFAGVMRFDGIAGEKREGKAVEHERD